MSKKQNQNFEPVATYRGDNSYGVTRRDMSTPYYKSFAAAVNEEPSGAALNSGKAPRFYNPSEPRVASTKVSPSAKSPKRTFFLLLLLVLLAVFIAVPVLNYFSVMPEYTSFFIKTSADEAPIGTEDIVMSTVKYFTAPDEENDYYFFNDCLKQLDTAETLDKIAFYALPITFVLSLIIALVFLIRTIVALATRRRRKIWALGPVLMLVLTLLGAVAGFIWSGLEWADFLNYIPFTAEAEPETAITLQLTYGYMIEAGVSLLAILCAAFSFRSKKKVY